MRKPVSTGFPLFGYVSFMGWVRRNPYKNRGRTTRGYHAPICLYANFLLGLGRTTKQTTTMLHTKQPDTGFSPANALNHGTRSLSFAATESVKDSGIVDGKLHNINYKPLANSEIVSPVDQAFNIYRYARANFFNNMTDEHYELMLLAARNLYDVTGGRMIVQIPSWDCSHAVTINS